MNACTKFHAVRTHGLGDRGLKVKYLYFAEFQEKWSEILRVNRVMTAVLATLIQRVP